MAIENKPQGKIGVPRLIVIDNKLYSKSKTHVGRILLKQWIFGGSCCLNLYRNFSCGDQE